MSRRSERLSWRWERPVSLAVRSRHADRARRSTPDARRSTLDARCPHLNSPRIGSTFVARPSSYGGQTSGQAICFDLGVKACQAAPARVRMESNAGCLGWIGLTAIRSACCSCGGCGGSCHHVQEGGRRRRTTVWRHAHTLQHSNTAQKSTETHPPGSRPSIDVVVVVVIIVVVLVIGFRSLHGGREFTRRVRRLERRR